LVQGQTTDVRRLKQKEAIVKMDLGEARVMVGAKTFDHVINIKNYEGKIEQIERALLDIENVIKKQGRTL